MTNPSDKVDLMRREQAERRDRDRIRVREAMGEDMRRFLDDVREEFGEVSLEYLKTPTLEIGRKRK